MPECDHLGSRVAQRLIRRFGLAFPCLIFCFDFVQIFGPRIRLMSNKKDRNFYENGQFLPLFKPVSRGLREFNALTDVQKISYDQ